MARKSRKITVEKPVAQPMETSFPTAIYARLSVENSGKSEKIDVIQNQIDICMEYVKSCPYLSLTDVYIDNGHTGTVFDRPEFNRLMNDIRSGRIKCLVVRDLSRFGRDYIETGTYLERIFPQIGLRFIAIKEHYDSFDTGGSNESLIIPLQNMINALYSKDISRKVSTALRSQMEQGTFRKRNLPYGYRWNEEHTNMVIDEETAPIVKQIFQWKIEGFQYRISLNGWMKWMHQIQNSANGKSERVPGTDASARDGRSQLWTESLTARNTVTLKKHLTANIPTCPAALMRQFSEETAFLRRCPRIING